MSRYILLDADQKPIVAGSAPHVAVIDTKLELMWPVAYAADTRLARAEARVAASAVSLFGYSDWRLAECDELLSLVDRTRFNPAVNTDLFPGTKPEWHVSSSAVAGASADYAWFVNLLFGFCYDGALNYTGWVRAVRSVVPSSSGQ